MGQDYKSEARNKPLSEVFLMQKKDIAQRAISDGQQRLLTITILLAVIRDLVPSLFPLTYFKSFKE